MGCFECIRKTSKNIISKIKKIQVGTINEGEIPTDPYLCPDCRNILEILDIDAENGYIKTKCIIDDIKEYPIEKFFEKTKKFGFNKKYKCANCEEIQSDKNNKYTYCSLCEKEFCSNCSNNFTTNKIKKHKMNHKQSCFPVDEKPSKCLKHINYEINAFCETCNENVCDEDLKLIHNTKEHSVIKYISLQNEIKCSLDKIKKKNEDLKNIIKFNWTIINSYENFKNNYFHIKSILNLGESISIEKKISKISKEELICMENNLEKKLKMQKDAIKELQNLYQIKLNGNEEKLLLKKRHLDDKGLELISKIPFKNLKEIDLSENDISDISPLKNMNLPHSEYLNLSFNKIHDIQAFKELNSPKLKEICLQGNSINDYKTLINNKNFLGLERLRIENNNLLMDFKDLEKKLSQNYNNLRLYYKVETKEEFEEKYETKISNNKLDLSDKKTGNIILEDLYRVIGNDLSIKLQKLILRNNNIKDCSILSRIPLLHLRELDLSVNKITNLDFLAQMKMPKLENLFLDNNYINNLNPLIKFKKIEQSNLKEEAEQLIKNEESEDLISHEENENEGKKELEKKEKYLDFNFKNLKLISLKYNNFNIENMSEDNKLIKQILKNKNIELDLNIKEI